MTFNFFSTPQGTLPPIHDNCCFFLYPLPPLAIFFPRVLAHSASPVLFRRGSISFVEFTHLFSLKGRTPVPLCEHPTASLLFSLVLDPFFFPVIRLFQFRYSSTLPQRGANSPRFPKTEPQPVFHLSPPDLHLTIHLIQYSLESLATSTPADNSLLTILATPIRPQPEYPNAPPLSFLPPNRFIPPSYSTLCGVYPRFLPIR